MKCPTDGAELVMSERQGVEIDYCPSCRGVWLDRGELDKIIDRASDVPSAAPSSAGPPAAPGGYGDSYGGGTAPIYRDAAYPDRARDAGYRDAGYRDGYRDDRYRDGRRPQRKRKDSFLEDLFDF